jgi:hypothetical protein
LRLDPEILGAPEHLRDANPGHAEPMPDLAGVRRYALETQQHHQSFEAGIG